MAGRTLISFDWAVKRLLRQKANFDILEGFLTELLRQDIRIQSILESQSNKENEEDKYNQVDILCLNHKGELIYIEIQFYSELDYFHRILYASSKIITEHIKEGIDYENVKKVYSINILYFDLGSGEDYIYHGQMDFKGMRANDRLKLSYGQISKFGKVYPGEIYPEVYLIKVNNFDDIATNTLDEWIYFLKHTELPKNYKAKGLKEVAKKLNLEKMDTTVKKEYIDYLKNVRLTQKHIDSVRLESHIEGREEGRQEGEKQKLTEVVLNSFDNEISISMISNITNLAEEEVVRILVENGRSV